MSDKQQTQFSNASILEAGKYYKKTEQNDTLWQSGDYYFKCEKTAPIMAYGVELYVVAGHSDLYIFSTQCHNIFSKWIEISKEEFTKEALPYLARFQDRFS